MIVTDALDFAISPDGVVHVSTYVVVPESGSVSRFVASLPVAKSPSFFVTTHCDGFMFTLVHEIRTAPPECALFGCTMIVLAARLPAEPEEPSELEPLPPEPSPLLPAPPLDDGETFKGDVPGCGCTPNGVPALGEAPRLEENGLMLTGEYGLDGLPYIGVRSVVGTFAIFFAHASLSAPSNGPRKLPN